MNVPADILIRPATIHDVPRVHSVITQHAERGRMLFKSYAQLYEDLRDYAVADAGGEVVGCVALSVIWSDLAEVRALAVDEATIGRGVGRKLVEGCVAEARRLQVRRLMALTYEPAFFARLGFGVVDKHTLPLKVWSDCVRCPKNLNCDEVAMVRVLEDVPIVGGPAAAPTPRGVSIPVLPAGVDD